MLIDVRRCAVAAVLILAMTMAACGGSDEEPAGANAEPQATIPADDGESAATDDDGNLPLGERAVVDYIQYGPPEIKTQLGVTVAKVRKGKLADFKDFNLDAEQKNAVPYYVDTRFENLGSEPLDRNLIEPSAEDADGQEYASTTLIVLNGTFKPCPDASEKKLQPGDAFTGCATIFIPNGKELERVRFEGDVTKDPVFWQPA
jgi:hypothetical protein